MSGEGYLLSLIALLLFGIFVLFCFIVAILKGKAIMDISLFGRLLHGEKDVVDVSEENAEAIRNLGKVVNSSAEKAVVDYAIEAGGAVKSKLFDVKDDGDTPKPEDEQKDNTE